MNVAKANEIQKKAESKFRILVVDNDEKIFKQYYNALQNNVKGMSESIENIIQLETDLQNDFMVGDLDANFDVVCCNHLDAAFSAIQTAVEEENRFMVAFVEANMFPSVSDKNIAEKFMSHDPYLEIVLVKNFTDLTPEESVRSIESSSRFFYLSKPCQLQEIRHFALVLGSKWYNEMHLQQHTENLKGQIREQMESLLLSKSDLIEEMAKRAVVQNDLKSYENLYHTLAQITTDSVVLHHFWQIIEVNDASAKMFGYSGEELIGKSFYSLFPEEDLDMVRERFFSTESDSFEGNCIRKAGDTFCASIVNRMVQYKGKTIKLTVIREVKD